jgi:integrase
MKERPYQANRLLAVISSLYSFAERQGLVPKGFNPAKKVEKYREHRRERFLTGEELERVGSALREGETVGIAWSPDDEPESKHLPRPENRRTLLSRQATDAIRMLIFTGARLREILDLKWENVDLERGLLLLPDSKTGRKTIVLNEAAIDILKGHPKLGPYVIAGDKPDMPRTDLRSPGRRFASTLAWKEFACTTFATPLRQSALGPALVFRSSAGYWGIPSLRQRQGTPTWMPTRAKLLKKISNV